MEKVEPFTASGDKYLAAANDRIDGISFLKILGSIIIIFHHYQQVFDCRFGGINFYGGRFYFGNFVELFFLISGFLTVYTTRESRNLLQSLFHKLIRLYPVPLIACIFTLLLKTINAYTLGDGAAMSSLWNVRNLMLNFFLLFRGWPKLEIMGINNPTWYLCCLIQCYLLYYIILFISRKLHISEQFLFALLFAVNFLLRDKSVVTQDGFRAIESFYFGILIYCVINSTFREVSDRFHVDLRFCMFCIPALVFSLLRINGVTIEQRDYALFGIFPFFVLLAYALQNFHSRLIATAGQITFSVYVWHFPFMYLLKLCLRLFGISFSHTYLTMTAVMMLIWAVSFVLFKTVEIPVNSLLKKLEKRVFYRNEMPKNNV